MLRPREWSLRMRFTKIWMLLCRARKNSTSSSAVGGATGGLEVFGRGLGDVCKQSYKHVYATQSTKSIIFYAAFAYVTLFCCCEVRLAFSVACGRCGWLRRLRLPFPVVAVEVASQLRLHLTRIKTRRYWRLRLLTRCNNDYWV